MKEEFNSGFLAFGLTSFIFYILGASIKGDMGELFLIFGLLTLFMSFTALGIQILIWIIPTNKSLEG